MGQAAAAWHATCQTEAQGTTLGRAHCLVCRSYPLMAGQPDVTFPCACVGACLLQVGSQAPSRQSSTITNGWAVWLEHHSSRLYRLAMAGRSACNGQQISHLIYTQPGMS